MTRTVFENSMVAHVWAQQNQPSGKSNNGNFFFNGQTLYSYGSHFVVGRIMKDKTALLATDSYSISTTRHQRYAHNAVSGTFYHVPALTKLNHILDSYEHGTGESKASAPKQIINFCIEHAEEMSSDVGVYLLSLCKIKNPIDRFETIKAQAIKQREKEELEAKEENKREQIRYGKIISTLDDSGTVQHLAQIFRNRQTLNEAKKLYHSHRALKSVKREKQARKVWEVLQLVRAEITRQEKSEARKNANRYLRHLVKNFRDCKVFLVEAFNSNECIGSYHLREFGNTCSKLSELPRFKNQAREKFAAIAAQCNEAYNTALAIEHAEREREELERAQAWFRGDRGAYAPHSTVTLLRAIDVTRSEEGIITGGELQTSRGASVPLTHAIRAFRFIKLIKQRASVQLESQTSAGHFPVDAIAWQRNGHSIRVGHFGIDTIWTSGNFRAGCHHIVWSEIERLARELNVFTLSESNEAETITETA